MGLLTGVQASGIVYRLGWTLLHTLWLGAGVAALLAMAMLVLRRRSANARYLAGSVALALLVVLPVATFFTVSAPPRLPPVAEAAGRTGNASGAAPAAAMWEATVHAAAEPSGPVANRDGPALPPDAGDPRPTGAGAETPKALSLRAVAQVLEPLLPWIVLAWAIGVLLLSLRQLAGWIAARRLRQLASQLGRRDLIETVFRLARAIGVRRRLKVLDSALVRVPTVIGWLKPVILLPAGLATGLPPHQLEAILAHELAHIRRYDYLVNLLQSLVETLLFYHPAVWFISQRIRAERENCCDDIAVAAGAERLAYAESLLHVAQRCVEGRAARRISPAPALGAVGKVSQLRSRVGRLLGQAEERTRLSRSWPVAAASAAAALVATYLFVNTGARPAGATERASPATQPAPLAADRPGLPREQMPSAGDDFIRRKPREYTMRRPSYSLRDEPLRVKPRTLEQARPTPEEAVVFGWPIRWWSSHWIRDFSLASAMRHHEDRAEFIVTALGGHKVWVKYFDVPIDPWRYPILVMTYRAENIHPTSDKYNLYIDDGSGPDYGGLQPVRQKDLIADGNKHVLACDLRDLEPIGDLIGLAVLAENDGKQAPGVLELLELRFEAAELLPAVELEDSVLVVSVTDPAGRPVAGATVTVDAERSNWARSAVTDAAGKASVRPYRTKSGRHMIRVTKPGHLPTEIRDLPAAGGAIEVNLARAMVYRGVVLDENGKLLAGAIVRIDTPSPLPAGQWTRHDCETIADGQGAWASPPMPAEVASVNIHLAHGDYQGAHRHLSTHSVSAEALRDGTKALSILPETTTVAGTVVDQALRPISHATVRAIPGRIGGATTDAGGNFEVKTIPAGAAAVMVQHEGYAPAIADVRTPRRDGQKLQIQLTPAKRIRGRVTDTEGQAVAGAYVRAVLSDRWRIYGDSLIADQNGRFEWGSAPDAGITYEVSAPGYFLMQPVLQPGENEHVIQLQPRQSRPAEPGQDPRRPGYDPFRIFRQISRAGWPGDRRGSAPRERTA